MLLNISTFIFQLEITVLNTDISPKSVLYLNVTGPPLSKVGFLAVDKAVYQISVTEILLKVTFNTVNLNLNQCSLFFVYYFHSQKIIAS
jgi:hypothetical protein